LSIGFLAGRSLHPSQGIEAEYWDGSIYSQAISFFTLVKSMRSGTYTNEGARAVLARFNHPYRNITPLHAVLQSIFAVKTFESHRTVFSGNKH
jgi:hypothetical protein